MDLTEFHDLVRKARSYRRYNASEIVTAGTLRKLVDLARMTSSARNKQPLKYITVNDPNANEEIFSCLGWAAALKDWKGPSEEERPAAYIVILEDKDIRDTFGCDHGIAAQTIMLGAMAGGLGSCMLGSVNKAKLRKLWNIPEHLEILLVVSIGVPGETITLETMKEGDAFNYWRDENSVHHVPKRSLEEVIVEEKVAE